MHACAFSADGSAVLTASKDGAIFTWDAATGVPIEAIAATNAGSLTASATWNVTIDWKLERTIGSTDSTSVFADRVTALDFSPDGTTLAAGSGEPSRSGEIKLFDVASGEEKLALKDPHSDTVNCLAFSPDGKQVASCAADRFIKLWNVADGKFIRSFEGHTHHVLGIAWKPDGRVLVSSGADLVLKIWDARTGDQLRTVQNQFTKEVTSVTFAADETVLAAGGDAKVRFINATNGSNQRDFGGTTEYMYSVAASADGKTILAGGLDSILRLWSDDGKELAKFAPPTPSKDKTAAN
jgi:WD40 repeat protein